MKTLIIALFLISISSVAQIDKNIDCGTKILAATSIQDAVNIANTNLSQHIFCLFIQGGIAPIYYKGDLEFEKKYNLNITDFGCVGIKEEIVAAYNQEVFRYLDKKFGNKWRRELRKDVIGFQQYLKNNKEKR